MPYNFEQPPINVLDPLQKNAINHPINENEVLIIKLFALIHESKFFILYIKYT